MENYDYKNRVGFSIGTGRCGTKFLHKVFEIEPKVSSVHERNSLNETFHRYCQWYGITVDHEGFLQQKEREIQLDLIEHRFSFESSAYLSLSLEELYQRFGAKFILLVRRPDEVVNSYLYKGWYSRPTIRSNPNLPPTYQISKDFHHFLGRVLPSGEKFEQWQKLTRVGKLAWYWNALNTRVLEQFENIPPSQWRVEKLEELSFDRYLEIAQFFGVNSKLKHEAYQKIVESRPNSVYNDHSILTWTEQEIAEFETEVEPIATKLGYEYKINQLKKTQLPKSIEQKPKQSLTIVPKQISAKDVTAIVRSVGERTEEACRYLLSEQVPEENIITINEVPFSAAVAKTFKLGLERGLPWTLCIDADVLLKEGAVAELLAVAEKLDENVFEIQANVLCKFYGGFRQAGNHLYRTSLLAKALECIPTTEVIRPETATILQMEKRGFPWYRQDFVVGLHDYEQYYKDIYRKAFIFAHKHRHISIIEPMWQRLASEDRDYQIALWGLRAGRIFDGEVTIDIRQFPNEIDNLLLAKGWQEKSLLSTDEIVSTKITDTIANFTFSPEYIKLTELKKQRQNQSWKNKNWKNKIYQLFRKALP